MVVDRLPGVQRSAPASLVCFCVVAVDDVAGIPEKAKYAVANMEVGSVFLWLRLNQFFF